MENDRVWEHGSVRPARVRHNGEDGRIGHQKTTESKPSSPADGHLPTAKVEAEVRQACNLAMLLGAAHCHGALPVTRIRHSCGWAYSLSSLSSPRDPQSPLRTTKPHVAVQSQECSPQQDLLRSDRLHHKQPQTRFVKTSQIAGVSRRRPGSNGKPRKYLISQETCPRSVLGTYSL